MFHKQIFNPYLGAIRDTDHLRPQAEMRGQKVQVSGEGQVGMERLADLLRSKSALGQCEDRIPGENGNGRLAGGSQPYDGLLGDDRPKMFRDAVMVDKGQDCQPWSAWDGAAG